MVVNLSPVWGAGAQLLDNSGNVLSGGKIYTYAAGTTTPATTYTSISANTANSNPIVLNSAGRVPNEIWLVEGSLYKFVLKDSNDTLIGTWDNIEGVNSNFVNYINQQEIQTATAGQTVFTLADVTYEPGTGTLSVFVDGVNQYGPGSSYAFVETNSTTVTFTEGLHVGAEVKFTTTQLQNGSGGGGGDSVWSLNGSTAYYASGDVVVGGNTAQGTSTATPQLQNQGTDAGTAAIASFRFSNDQQGPSLRLFKTRGASPGLYEPVNDDDHLGTVSFWGTEPTADADVNSAMIQVQVDGTPSTNIVPSRIVFVTSSEATGAAETMRLTGEGYLGIGTDTPQGALDVDGDIYISGDARKIVGNFNGSDGNNRTFFQNDTVNTNTRIGVVPNGTGSVAAIDLFSDEDTPTASRLALAITSTEAIIASDIPSGGSGTFVPLTFQTNNLDRMTIAVDGKVGIGTDTPTQELDINGDVAITGSARRISGDFSNSTIANRTLFQTSTVNGVTGVRAIPNGTSNQASFGVYNNSDPTNSTLVALGVSGSNAIIQSTAQGSGSSLPLAVVVGGSERLSITTAGDVGIGTTTPGQKLSVAGVVESTTGGFKFPDGTTQTTAASGGGGSPAGSTGQVQYNNAGAFGALPDGTTGQVLTSSGTGVAPTWTTPSGTTQWTTSGSDIYYAAGKVGIGTSTVTENLTVDGNADFVGTSARIKGKFEGTSLTDRTLFTSRTTNNNSRVGVIPNGTATTAAYDVFSKSDVATSSRLAMVAIDGSDTRIASDIPSGGSGSYLPMTFYTNNAEVMRLTTAGNVGVGTTTPSTKLDVTGTFNATGAATLGSTLGVTGTLNANGGIAVDTNAFTVADTTGNTAIAGTLNVTGVTTLTGLLNANNGIAVDTNSFTVDGTTGAIYTASIATISGDLAVNGGDMTSTATTFNLLNSTITTLNAGGAATAVTIGANGSGTTTIRNATTAMSGAATVGSTLGVTGDTTLSGNLTMNGSAKRIVGDFTNATAANRTMFQTITANSNTSVRAIPSGTATGGGFGAHNNSDPTNSGFVSLGINNTNAFVQSTAAGTGTTLPLYFVVGATEGARFDTSGNFIANASIREKQVAIAASDIDLSLGNYYTKTISATTSFTVSNVPASGTAASFILDLTNGGSQTVNFMTGIKWAGGTAPTLTASGRDVLGFFTYDGGTTWNGFVLGKAMA